MKRGANTHGVEASSNEENTKVSKRGEVGRRHPTSAFKLFGWNGKKKKVHLLGNEKKKMQALSSTM